MFNNTGTQLGNPSSMTDNGEPRNAVYRLDDPTDADSVKAAVSLVYSMYCLNPQNRIPPDINVEVKKYKELHRKLLKEGNHTYVETK